MKKIQECKFKIGDKVSHKPDLYGMIESVVTEIERKFTRTFPFKSTTLESHVKDLRKELNARIENINGVDCFIHDGDESCGLKPEIAPFAGYSIITKNSKMNTIWPERALTKI